jgi:hypothetical protein
MNYLGRHIHLTNKSKKSTYNFKGKNMKCEWTNIMELNLDLLWGYDINFWENIYPGIKGDHKKELVK